MTPYTGICRWNNGVCDMATIRDNGGNEMDITRDQYEEKYQAGKVEPSYILLNTRK